MEEETASDAERDGWAAAEAAQKALDDKSTRCWEVAAKKMAASLSEPSRAEKPKENRTKDRHDPSTRTRMEEAAS